VDALFTGKPRRYWLQVDAAAAAVFGVQGLKRTCWGRGPTCALATPGGAFTTQPAATAVALYGWQVTNETHLGRLWAVAGVEQPQVQGH
jgi:hypothetical protein